jgi:chorismate-pyruvate lyase
MVAWYSNLINSNRSTTEFIRKTFKSSRFETIEQHERDDTIVRESRFIVDDKPLIISRVFIPINNPPAFLRQVRDRSMPLGDIIKENEYHVQRNVLSRDRSSKHYTIGGDVQAEIWETYLG